MVEKVHRGDGVSPQVEGRARLAGDGAALFEARVPVASFDSGNVNRDAHMKEVVDAARFPSVELRALAAALTPPTSYPATIEVPFTPRLTLHGVQNTLTLPVPLTSPAPRRLPPPPTSPPTP